MQSTTMNRLVHVTMSVVFSGLVVFGLSRQFDVGLIIQSVQTANLNLLIGGAALLVLAYLLRGMRWRIWERGLTYRDSLRLILIGFMGNNILPARLGEVLRAHCTAARTGQDRGRTTALASIAVERILDGLVLAMFGLVGIALVEVDNRLHWALFLASLAFGGLTLALVVSIRQHERIRSFVATAHRRFPGHVTAFAREKTFHFLNGLLPLDSRPRMLGSIAATVAIWSIEVGVCYLVGRAVWDQMTVGTALLFLVVVNFASLIPLTVGGIGTIEAVAPVYLISSGVATYPALTMVLVQHAAQYAFTTISGAVLYFSGGFHRMSFADPKAPRAVRPGTVTDSPADDEASWSLSQLSGVAELNPTPRRNVDLSIVIPAYNEQARLPRTVLETIRWCTSRNVEFEVVIVDDGSRDGTLRLAHLFEESDSRIRALACPHMGKGAAVRLGMLNSKGHRVLFMDADGATPLSELPKLAAALETGHDIAIGSRVRQYPGEVEVKTSLHRKVIGRVFALFVNLFAIEGIADTQCGFKMFDRMAVAAIFGQQKISGFAFDVEVLYLARRLSLSIAEIPVNWTAQPGSKVNLVTDSMRMLWEISRIRWMHRKLPAHRLMLETRHQDSRAL